MAPQTLCFLDQGEIYGGAECFLLDHLEHLSSERWRCILITSSRSHKKYRERVRNIPHLLVYTLPLFKSLPVTIPVFLRSFFVFIALLWIVWSEKASLIISNTARGHLMSGVVGWTLGIPRVWIMHDLTFPKKFGYVASLLANTLICVSDYVQSYVLQLSRRMRKKKMMVIPNGIPLLDNAHVEMLRLPDGTTMTKQKDEFWIGIVGRIDIWKGQDIFIKAAQRLTKANPSIKFLIVGEETATTEERKQYIKDLHELISSSADQQSIIFTGFQEKETIFPLLDLLVHASTEPEPFGRTIIEAWAAKIPVIASNCGAPASIITHEKTGILVKESDVIGLSIVIERLFHDSSLRQRLSTDAYEEYQVKYTLKSVLERYEMLYISMIK